MAYKVLWKKLPGGSIISEENYSTREEALESADIVKIGGPSDVEIMVLDEFSKIIFKRTMKV